MRFERRPWGWFLKLYDNGRFWIKILRVRGRTSEQSHDHRAELLIRVWDPVFIRKVQKDTVHRLGPGWWIEFAWGKVDEKDCVRYKDDYGRA